MGRPARVTREEVLAQARRAFAERGFDGTTPRRHRRAPRRISPAALLRHAPSKKALFALAMESQPPGEKLPTEFLASVPADADPVEVLRRLARVFIPFIEQKMGENIARFLRASTGREARTIRLPFDPRKKTSLRPWPSGRSRVLAPGGRRRTGLRAERAGGSARPSSARCSPTSSFTAFCGSSRRFPSTPTSTPSWRSGSTGRSALREKGPDETQEGS